MKLPVLYLLFSVAVLAAFTSGKLFGLSLIGTLAASAASGGSSAGGGRSYHK